MPELDEFIHRVVKSLHHYFKEQFTYLIKAMKSLIIAYNYKFDCIIYKKNKKSFNDSAIAYTLPSFLPNPKKKVKGSRKQKT